MKRMAARMTMLALAVLGVMEVAAKPPYPYEAVGQIWRRSPGLDALIAPGTRIEKLADGFTWSEGPVWIPQGRYLLFSDVPANTMHRWSAGDGASVFLKPSGYDGTDTAQFREPGSNGLIRGPGNTILVADHGNRAIARLDLATRKKTLLATTFEGKRFNSPNDLVLARNGAIYFTDPPYGLAGINDSPQKEQKVNGVYRLDPGGKVTLIEGGLTFPNGIILSPDERRLYVTVSDPKHAVIMVYDRAADGSVSNGRVFVDMTDKVSDQAPGLPDGLAIDSMGNLFSSGPGGIHVIAPDGRELGLISTGTAIANCKFGEDGRTLFMTSNHMLVRLRTKTKGLGF